MRKAVVLGGGLLLCLVGVIVFAQLFGSGSVLFPATLPVRVFSSGLGLAPLSNVTVNVYSPNAGNYTVVTVIGWDFYPILYLRINASYSVTATWQDATLTKIITVTYGSCPVLQVQVDTTRMLIAMIDFWPYW
ncbi:hypothetical protein MUP01_10740 [Candidatus Bathyarchaeota archaeon]|jgi:hypothetical protein|nr:hypothetical protein [Candidatus Bathyarchaeota archaeon]